MRRQVVTAALMILAAVVLVKVYLESPAFELKRVRIVGDLSDSQYRQLVEKLKLYKGRNLVDLRLNDLSRDLLESFPWIQDLAIRKRLPDVLEISIETWAPFAVLDVGDRYLVDRSGRKLAPLSDGDSRDLPVVRIRPAVERGGIRSDRLRFALELVDRMRAAGVSPKLVEFVGKHAVKIELACGSVLEFSTKNAFECLDWLVNEWGRGESNLCRYGWVFVVRQGKFVIKRGT